jgi:hypothetical protein
MLACPSWCDTRSGRAPAASAKLESDRADTRRDEHQSFGLAPCRKLALDRPLPANLTDGSPGTSPRNSAPGS